MFRDGQLTALRIRPVLLNEMGQTGPRFNATRGAPRAATGADARRVLTEFATLSKDYGTILQLGDGFATVNLSTNPSTTPNSP